ncbi:glutathione S-transferase [Paraburkholderia sp. GAS42]|jgi:glutathione S-transferase|uniref:glutathione S-transferase n=1 Tax=Paraburkholderia sp. GAS42 TaxID=3035135 RepID=UPI003D223225
MKLIGMLDSPYVRRVAIGMKLLGLDFEHQSLSVFRGFDEFLKINPTVKAPTLMLDDGQILIESTLILDYVETLAAPEKSLIPRDPAKRVRATRLNGFALAACDKTAQIVYERNLRPAEKQYEPWVERVRTQLLGAYAVLEADLAAAPLPQQADALDQAGMTVAVAWRFTQMMLPEIVVAGAYPQLRSYSAFAEQLPVFLDTPPD